MRTPIFTLAIQSLWNRRWTAFLTVLAVALSVTLFLGVEKLREGARDSFENTISRTDLIVGARSSPINLLLYSVFRIGDATADISWDSYEMIRNRPEVDWTVPVSLGDSHRGFRVMGTTTAYFDHYRYGGNRELRLAEGQRFEDLYDAVIGADVARSLGYGLDQRITLSHGIGSVSFAEHDNRPFRVSGILAPTGTPVDKTVHVSLEAIEAIHVGWESGAPSPMARMITADQVREFDLQPKRVTAVFVGLKPERRARILTTRYELNRYRPEALQAIRPLEALTQLWSVIGIAERVLIGVSLFVIFVGLVSILTSILTSLNERRREMAILRSVGARPWHILILLVCESALLGLIGALLGAVLVYGVLAFAGPIVEAQYGVVLTQQLPGLFDFQVVGAVTFAALVMGLIPAWQAYRNSLADGLSIKL